MEKLVLPRRTVLRVVTAIGCGWMQIALSADDTKKMPQASVQYQVKPKGEQKCGACMHFIAKSNTCKLVDGSISPEGWCRLWVKKA